MNAMLEEQRNVEFERPDEKPPNFGLTIIAKPTGSTPQELVIRLRAAWSPVASWGRWCDEHLGDWPADQELLAALPEPVRSGLEREASFVLTSWSDDLHDREWIWWSSAVIGERIKLDINAFSLPVTLWPLKSLVEWGGGIVVAQGDWMPSDHTEA